jgi:hypothetical protein
MFSILEFYLGIVLLLSKHSASAAASAAAFSRPV